MSPIDRGQIESALSALGELLSSRGKHYEVVLVGGANLILSDFIDRPTTKDLDLLGAWTARGIKPMKTMPEPLRVAIVDVGRVFGLADDWMNLGPQSLLDLGLPRGFKRRLQRHDYGGLVVWSAARVDMIFFKLYAAADQGPRSRHFQDLGALEPSRAELLAAARWARTHDPSPGFRHQVLDVLALQWEDIRDDDLD
jgi:hypothetical protein